MKKRFIISLILLATIGQAKAQYDPRAYSYSIKLGSSQFYGDIATESGFLNPFSFFASQGFYTGVSINRNFDRLFTLRAEMDFASLRSKREEWYNARMESNILQGSISISTDLIHIINPDLSARRQKIYVEPFIGIGVSAFKAEVFDLTTQELMRYSSACCTKMALPMGLIISYDVSKSLALGLNFKMTSISTDILDATNGGVPNGNLLRGKIYDLFGQDNNSAKDKWGSFSLVSTFKFGSIR